MSREIKCYKVVSGSYALLSSGKCNPIHYRIGKYVEAPNNTYLFTFMDKSEAISYSKECIGIVYEALGISRAKIAPVAFIPEVEGYWNWFNKQKKSKKSTDIKNTNFNRACAQYNSIMGFKQVKLVKRLEQY
jgi:hypothetical protein